MVYLTTLGTRACYSGTAFVACVLAACLTPSTLFASQATAAADEIRQAAGIAGGVIVHLGCGDGELTAALRANDSCLVQGLDSDAGNVARARTAIRERGLYGVVSVDRLISNRLPYADNLVNLIVVDDPEDVSLQELMRVLCPGGVLMKRQGDSWTRTVKPTPAEIDEWTHVLYDASNNAVSRDSVVGPPKQLQWVGEPKWQRSHDHLASVSAVVSSGGRLFSIGDAAPIAAVILAPRWQLVARDAFNGVVLWRREIPDWTWHLRGFRSGPVDLSRRLVAVGDRVYVTLGIDAPVSALDAATGETIHVYQGTENALEIVYLDGKLYVVTGDPQAQQAANRAERHGDRPGFGHVRPQRPAYVELPPPKGLVVLNADSGEVLWTKRDAATAELMPTTVAVTPEKVFFQNAGHVLCLDSSTGEEKWRAERKVSRSRPTWSAPTLVVYESVVLSGDRAVAEKKTLDESDRPVEWLVSSAGGRAPVGELIAFSADTGERLWSTTCKENYNAPVDVLVADGLVWTGLLVRANEPGITEGRDPRTGEVKRTRPSDLTFFAPGMGHGRCYRNRGTPNYLVLGRSGVEFVDLKTGDAAAHHWTRGTCQFGVLPCNGMLYVTPHTCACFIRSKLHGLNCFVPRGADDSADQSPRYERGPAFTATPQTRAVEVDASGWPTFRHDAARSGVATTALSENLQPAWRLKLGGKLSSVVVADGKLLVAQVDRHTIHAIDAERGEPLWSYVAGGRVDSPPTFWQGRVLFGSADGWTYCLRADDGRLEWRYRAAPQDRRMVSYGQLESAWPVHGSVLVQDGVAYCAAGRSSYLDGGIRVVRLDAKSGKLLSETVIDHRDPETGFQVKGSVKSTNMPGALPDVLSSDGESVFMRHSRFNLQGEEQPADVPHLYSAAGFLEDAWWHRTYWQVSAAMSTNYGGWPNTGSRAPAGRLLVVDQDTVYGFGRSQYIHHGAHVGIDGATVFHFRPSRDSQRRFTHYQAFAIHRASTVGSANRRKPAPAAKEYAWTARLPIVARAMVLAGENLFFAGPPNIFESDDPQRAWEGCEGGKLCVVSRSGKQLGLLDLESPPIFDGLAAANQRLYAATMDGSVVCLRSE
jgi:outer membrane protein assembly factor BamB